MTKAKILIVEDDSIIAQDIQYRLKHFGYTVVGLTATGEGALKQTSEKKPDLVLMDILLKGAMDGVEAAMKIRTMVDIPVVYLTAYTDEKTLQRAKKTEPYGYIIKPFEEKELRTAIEMALYKHKMEKKLKESEERYRIVTETATDVIITIDEKTNVVYTNKVVERTFGFSPAQLIGKSVTMLVPETMQQKYQKSLKSYIKSNKRRSIFGSLQILGRHKNGTEIPLEISFSESDRDGKHFITGIIRDITKRKRIEDALRISQQRLEAINRIGLFASESLIVDDVLENILDGTLEATGASAGIIFIKDPPTERLIWGAARGLSDAFVSDYRKKAVQPGEGLTGRIFKTGKPIYIRENSSQDPRIARSVVSKEKLNSFIGVPIFAGKEVVAVLNILSRPPEILDEEVIAFAQAIGSQVGAVIRNARTYTEHKRLSKAIEQAAEAIMITDVDGKIQYTNPGFEKTTGFSNQEVLGETARILKSGKQDRSFYTHLWDTITRGEVWTGCFINKKKDGTFYEAEATISPIRNASGKIINYVSVSHDITERKCAEREQAVNLHYFKSMNQISEVLEQPESVDKILQDVLERILKIFKSDRARLLYPCDPESTYFKIPYEFTSPEYQIRNAVNTEIPIHPTTQVLFSKALATKNPVTALFDVNDVEKDDRDIVTIEQNSVQSLLGITLHPKIGKPWMLEIHQCSDKRKWSKEEKRLIKDIALRITDALTNRLLHNDLHESEKKYRTLVEKMNDGFMVSDADEIITMVNPRMCEIMGCTDESQLVGHSLYEFLDKKNQAIVRDEVKLRRTGISDRYELQVKRLDGKDAVFEISASPRLNETGEFTGSFGIWTDLTEKQEEKKLETTLYAISDVATIADSLYSLYAAIHEIIQGLIPTENFYIAMYDPNEDSISLPYYIDKFTPLKKAQPMQVSMGLTKYVLRNGRSLLLTKKEILELSKKGEIKTQGKIAAYWLGVPLKIEMETIGVIVVQTYSNQIALTNKHLRILEFVSTEIALVISRKQGEEALRKAQEYTQNLIDSSLDMIISVDKDRNIVEFNRAAEETFGYTKEEILGKNINILYADSSQGLAVHYESRRAGKFVGEITNIRKNGETFPCLLSASVLRDDKGNYLGVMGVSRDITRRKQAEKELKESEEKYRSLSEHSPVGIILHQDGKLLFINPAALQITGYDSKDKIIGKPVIEFVHPDYRELASERIQKVIKKKGAIAELVEEKFLRKDGTTVDVAVMAQSISYKGKPAVQVSFLDITERRLADERIKASLREKEVLLKEIHHRVKNNLQIIASLLDLQSKYIKSKQALQLFKESQNRVYSMALTHEHLYQSKDLAKIDFAKYVDHLTAHLFSTYGILSEGIEMQIEVADILLDIDRAMPCGLIINELVSNSLKYAFPPSSGSFSPVSKGLRTAGKDNAIREKGMICVELKSVRNNEIALIVSDNGVGFPDELDFRATESLGMQLVCTLTDQLDGKIEMNRNHGTKFKITLKA